MWRYIKQTLAILLSLAILATGAVAVLVKFHHGQFLSVQSESMAPSINKGDLVIVTRVPAAKLAIGDVVTFINPKNSKQSITHRVIALPPLTSGVVITKGDANSTADQPITTKVIIGKVQRSIPHLGIVVDFVRQPLGLIILIYIPALAIVFSEIKRLTAYYRQRQPYFVIGFGPPKALSLISKMGVFVIVFVTVTITGLLISGRVMASLRSSVVLIGSSFSVSNPQNHILISKLNLRCGEDEDEGHPTANRIPRITIYNPTNNTVLLDGWQLLDNSGVILTLPAHTNLQAGHVKIVRLHLSSGGLHGLQYAGDRLVMQDAAHHAIDGLSWGTDTTQLNPSISTLAAGTVITRSPINLDTNNKTDWTVSPHHCHVEHEDDGDHHETENEDDSERHEDSFDSSHNPHQDNGYDLREPNTQDD